MQDLKDSDSVTEERRSEPSADPKPETGQVEVNEPAPEPAAAPHAKTSETNDNATAATDEESGTEKTEADTSEGDQHYPKGAKYLAFKATIEDAIAESGACSSCRLVALTEILADQIVKESKSIRHAMELGSSVTQGYGVLLRRV